MSCAEHIVELRSQQEKTLELYKDLYDSFIATSRNDTMDSGQVNMSRYFNNTLPDTSNVTNMFDTSTPSFNSTCDIPRLGSQNTTITEMWNNFSIDKYAPRDVRKKRGAMSAPPVKRSKPRRPRVTVPDPFYMTLREELKKPTKTRAQEEAELKKITAELEEEAECSKQFKASPIPVSTYNNRLKQIQEKQEERRRSVKKHSLALTKALQKPFSFDSRASLRRSKSLSELDTGAVGTAPRETKFFARPMPHHLFDPEVDEKAREEAAYREIRMKMRAEQLLAESELPQNMRRHALHYTDGGIRRQIQEEKDKYAHLTEEHTFRPEIKDHIPDYSLLHKQQEEELLQRQSVKPTTIIEPFLLRTEQLAQCRAHQLAQTPVQSPEPPRHTYRKSPCQYTGVYKDLCKPARPTVGSELRDSATRQRIIQEKKTAQKEYEEEIIRKLKAVEIRRDIKERSSALDPTTNHRTQEKLRQKVASQKERELEYKERLFKMKEKMKSRPFLFERVSMDTAQSSADAAFRRALTEAGVDEELIREISHFEEDSLMVA